MVLLIMVRSLPMDRIIAAAGAPVGSSVRDFLASSYQIQPLAIFLFLLAPFLIIMMGAAFQILVSTWARNDRQTASQ